MYKRQIRYRTKMMVIIGPYGVPQVITYQEPYESVSYTHLDVYKRQAFEDISYQLAQPETRTAIFEHLCDLYNYVDASIHVQLSFLNRKA